MDSYRLLTGVLLMSMTIGFAQPVRAESPATEPTAASLAWTSHDPKVVQARAWISQGQFAQAEELLKQPDPTADASAIEARKQTLEIIRRIRIEYRFSAQDVVEATKDQLPNVTLDMVQRWQKAGQVQSRVIDGQICYFRQEPSNLFRFCSEAKAMLPTRPATQPKEPWTLVGHLQHVIAAAAASDSPYVLPVRHTLKYTLIVPPDAPGMKPGALVRVWLPFPQEFGRRQYDVRLISASPTGAQLAPLGTPQRSLYFEQRVGTDAKPLVFEESVEFTSAAYYPNLDPAAALPLPADYQQGNLGQRLPHIQFTPELKALVHEIVGSETNPLLNARKIYYWIAQNVSYYSEEEYCTIPSFAVACYNRRKGDCGIQSTLFITMARIAGIPARWQSGWETKPDDLSMHDWAEMYIAPWGWLPVDQSYGLQESDDPKVKEFYIGHLDSYRMIVNTNWGEPLVPPKNSLRSEPADFQRGEVEIDGNNLYFNQWKYAAQWNWETKP
jgi:transglutaminase-like putative cysteine protease